jgi:hypothetical protein
METLSQNTRISVTYQNRCNGRQLSCTITKDVPPDKTELQFLDEMENIIREYVDLKTQSYMTVQEIAQQFPPAQTAVSFPQQNNMTPPCPVCKAPTKLAKNGQYYNCTKASWYKGPNGYINNGCPGSVKV